VGARLFRESVLSSTQIKLALGEKASGLKEEKREMKKWRKKA